MPEFTSYLFFFKINLFQLYIMHASLFCWDDDYCIAVIVRTPHKLFLLLLWLLLHMNTRNQICVSLALELELFAIDQ